MSALIWKLLRQHISIGQLAGFFLANLFGMMIVLLSVQFYKDIIPVFTEGDSFMKKDFIIATKKISTLGSFAGKNNTFSAEDIADLKKQSFTKTIGAFTPSQFKVSAGLGMQDAPVHVLPVYQAYPTALFYMLHFHNKQAYVVLPHQKQPHSALYALPSAYG